MISLCLVMLGSNDDCFYSLAEEVNSKYSKVRRYDWINDERSLMFFGNRERKCKKVLRYDDCFLFGRGGSKNSKVRQYD